MAENSMERLPVDLSKEGKAPDDTSDSTAEEKESPAEDDDLDVIDCYTDDFDSDMEGDYCNKEAKKEKDRKTRRKDQINTVETTDQTDPVEKTNHEAENTRIDPLESPQEGDQEKNVYNTAPDFDDDDDEDVIQLCDDISDPFLDEPTSTSVADPVKPKISSSIENESEKDRILSEPLVKQMIVPDVCVSDEEDDRISVESKESLSLQIVHCVEKATKVMDEVKKAPASNNSNCSDSGLHQEDPDVLKLKLDLYQEMGGMDYETDDKTDDCEKASTVRIKQEPVAQQIFSEDIPTIELSSTDEEQEPVSSQQQTTKSPVEKRKKRKSKKKAKECAEIRPVSSEDSFPMVVDSTVSIKSRRTRNDSEGSLDDAAFYKDGRIKALRNRTVPIFPEYSCGKRTKSHRKSSDTDPSEAPFKKKKKIDPSMIGYHKRRKTTPGRSGSKCSLISASTATSSIPDDDMIVLSANDVLLTDPLIIEGGLTKNVENNNIQQQENNNIQPGNESKEELMHSLDLKETISKEFEHDTTLDTEKDVSEENHFPVPTTDIALEDMLDSFINNEQHGKDATSLFHTISPEEKFLMDSLFGDCEKQTPQVPSHEHLESLNSIMDDGKPLVEPLTVEQFAISYTVSSDIVEPLSVFMPMDNVSPVEDTGHDSKVPKAPNIKIIQNYQKYPFQAKAPKKQQPKTSTANSQPRKGRNRKKRETKDESDEEYLPSSNRTNKSKSKTQRSRKNSSTALKLSASTLNADHQQGENYAQQGKHHGQIFDNGDEDGTSACRNMPTLELDLALSSSDESFGAISKELVSSSPSKISSSSHEESSKFKTLGDDQPKPKGGGKHILGNRATVTTTKPLCVLPKRGRPKGSSKAKISDVYNPINNLKKIKTHQLSKASLDKGDKSNKKAALKQKLKRLFSSSEDEATPPANVHSATETEAELQLSASTIGSVIEPTEENQLEKTQAAGEKMDSLQIVISPLTEDKIRKINTPQKKPKAKSKASQTEISGLTWLIELDQIDFQSEYFEKLRVLMNNAAVHNVVSETKSGKITKSALPKTESSTSERSFNGVDIPCRSILQGYIGSTSPAGPQPISEGYNRSSAEDLLFQRAIDEVEIGANRTEDRLAVKKLERVVSSVRSSFRIPKLNKQASTSPQVVTSSTPHVAASVLDDLGTEPMPQVSRSLDQLSQNSRSSGSFRLPYDSGVVQRTVSNEYVNDRSGYGENGSATSRQDRNEMRQNIMLQERFELPATRGVEPGRNSPLRFENALNASYRPKTNALNGSQDTAQPSSNQETKSVPIPSSLENRPVLPSQAELMNVKRTIRNDMSQPPQLPMQQSFPPQPNVSSMFGGYKMAPYAANNNSFNRGSLLGYPGSDMMSMNGYNMGIQQQQNRGGSVPNDFTDFLSMLFDQLRQQQQLSMQQPFMPPPMVPPVVPMHNLQNMMGQSGSNIPPGFNQMYPQMSSAVQSQMSQNPVQSSIPPVEPQRASEQMEIICSIFGCIDFLSDKCIKTNCRYSHNTPRDEEVFQKLSIQSRDAIMASYRFVASRDDLFVKYFPVYATVMGRNNMRHQLVNTISDCEQSKRPIQYYKYIVEGLKISGTSPVQAMQIILEKHTKKSFHQLNVLIDLILDTAEGITTFLRTLEEFFHVKDYHYEIASINRLLEFCVLSMPLASELAAFVCKLILQVSVGDEHLVNTRVLLEFIQKVRVEPALALDVEDIVKKYGSVVMRP